jgi:hypothetical protein
MISIDYDVVVPDFTKKEVPHGTLVRMHAGKFQFDVTNNGRATITKLNVRAVLESYAGQEKRQLFQWADTQVIEKIPPKGMVSIEFEFWPWFPGLVSVALYVTDAANNAVKAKRQTASIYEEAPVRWYFHVADDIAFETLRALRELVARKKEKK